MGLSFSHAILSAAVLTCGLALKASVFDLLEPQLNGAQVLELLNNPNAAPKPDLTSIPATDFNCSQVSVAGYYADISTGCQVFHRCGKRGELNTYLCTAPTIFNQLTLVCDWWYQVNCERSVQLQDFTNSRLYLDIDVPLFDNPPPDYILQNFGQAAGNYVRNPYKNPYNRPRSTTLGGRTTSPAIRSGAPHRTKNRTTGSHSGRTPKSEEATDQFASDFPDVTDEVTTVSSSKFVHNPQITRYTVKQHTLKAQVTSNQKGGGVVTGPSLNGQNATQLSPRVDEEGNEILNEEGNEGGRQRNTPPANGSERGTSDGTAGGDDFDGTRDVDLETFATPRSVPSKSPSNTIRTALANQGRQTKSPKGTALGPKTEREGGNNVLTEASNGGSTDESELAESSITPNSANIPSGITLANGVRSQERPVSETPVKTTSKRPRRPTLRSPDGSPVTDVVTCVYTSWSATRRPIGRVMGEDVPVQYCTHIVYAYTSIYENKIFTLQPMLDDKTNGGMGNIANFVALKEKKQGLKALIGIGGWNSGGWIFSTMAETLDGRRIFIQSLIDFCGDNNFDGVFLDWLTPGVGERGGAAHDYENYGSLLTEMRKAFDAADGTKLIIGVTVSAAEGYVGNYDAEKVNQAADLVYLIAYDLSGYWNGTIMHPSAIFNEDGRASVDVALNLWLDAGISPGKIVLGIPTFARTYKLPNDTEPANAYGGVYNYDGVRGSISQAPGFLYYSETCARLQLGGYTVVRDPIMKVPYAFSADQIIMYDDEISIKEKVDYAKGLSLGGVYLFTVDEDDPKGFCGDPYPLSRAAAAAMTNGKVALGTPRVSTTQRCISAEKKCQEKVKCLIYPTMTYANASSDLWCGKEAVCVDPVSIVECPFPSSLKDPFQSKSSIFVSKGKSISTVKCKADLKNSSSKVAKINYLCTQEGILGKSLQEYVCPADTVFTPLYLKCVVSGKVADF